MRMFGHACCSRGTSLATVKPEKAKPGQNQGQYTESSLPEPIAALVGTSDLGQRVTIALGKADSGLGLVAGIAIALVATMSDRTLQTWARRSQLPAG